WLQLLLAAVEEWTSKKETTFVPAKTVSNDVLNLWEKINRDVIEGTDSQDLFRDEFPNYNALRHRFKKTFGQSPQQMRITLRMSHAKNLLLDTDLSIKEIAGCVGYKRQHEFARAFHQYIGVS